MPNEEDSDSSSEVCVPMDSVMLNGVAPQVGDMIQVPAKVTRIQGSDVYAEPENKNSSMAESEDQERTRLKAAMNGPQDTDNPGY